MKKITAFAIMILAVSAAVSAEKKERYFSPNNDGVQDIFEIPVKISDRHLVKSWKLVITDESGKTIRTIGNKVSLPSKLTFKGFFKQLAAPNTGVAIPSSIIWNGAMDNGETAPDGKYFYYIEAYDDNGNKGITDSYPVVVDTVSPLVDITQNTDKIFGEGAKSEFRIKQTGSSEDLWTGRFRNASGEVVKTINWKGSEPLEFKWNGTDDSGKAVPDGVYSYDVTSTDRAGNVSEYAGISNIIYSAEKPATNIILTGNKYFSPKTESKLSSIKLDVTIPVPEKTSGNALTSWSVKIMDASGKVCRTFDEKNTGANPPSEFVFDGTDGNGKVLPNGKYQAVVNASYLNGYVPQTLRSPEFILDVTKPGAVVTSSQKVFGGEQKPSVKFELAVEKGKLAAIPSWKGRIYNTEDKNNSVKEYDFGEFPPESVEWNGLASNGKPAQDGNYCFELKATDLAGNTGVITTEAVQFSTKDAKLLLNASETAFSPNGDKIKETVTFTPVVMNSTGITGYTFTIKNAEGKAVKTIQASSALPQNFVWDGKDSSSIICPDGKYKAELSITASNGSQASVQTPEIVLDTVKPFVQAETPYVVFSPDGDGVKDTVPVTLSKSTKESLWKVEITDKNGKAVKTETFKDYVRQNGKDVYAWNGSDDTGNKAPDGNYSVVLSSVDEAGNSFSTKLSGITLDSRATKAYLTAELDGISPNGDQKFDSQKFEIKTSVSDGISSWNFDIVKADGTSVRSWSDKDSVNLPSQITWDGLDKDGKVCEGNFSGALKIEYTKGNKVTAVSSSFICTAKAPELSVKTAPQYFSPDNDGTDDDLFIKLGGTSLAPFKNWSFVIKDPKGKTFWQTKGTASITERIIWDGLSNVQKDSSGKAERVQSATDYPYEFTVTDTLGMTSVVKGNITVDVLVIRDGDVLKMAVPSIIFRSDAADFKTTKEVEKGLDPEQAANNERVLNRIAEILNKFKEYSITIEGHANRTTDLEDEENVTDMKRWGPALIPLSSERAEFVKNYLVKKGVSASRLSTVGKGGTELVVDFRDKDNNWKNRRVEFILVK